ncbi:MAG: two pore domain potassium channel family protein [Phycisphaerae bacterium]|nr:two pore domain potassium channel family protein [Phycisphaerae bacterium]
MTRNTQARLFRRFAAVGAVFVFIILLGSVGYWLITGMHNSLLNCAYMTIITITTVGFGEVIDLSDNPDGRAFHTPQTCKNPRENRGFLAH